MISIFFVDEGDLSSLYRSPAGSLLRFIRNLLGDRIFSFKFLIRTVVISIVFTVLLLSTYLIFVYTQSILHQTKKCPAPPLLMAFVGVPVYLSGILYKIFTINAVFDIITWSFTIICLSIIATTKKNTVVFCVTIGIVIFCIIILSILHAVYLPVSLAYEMNDYGISFGFGDYWQFFRNEITDSSRDLFSVRDSITVDCFLPPAHPFGISIIALTQFAALEALIPMILFGLICILGSIAYLTRGFTRSPLRLIIKRLAASKNVCLTIAAQLSVLLAILKVIVGSPH